MALPDLYYALMTCFYHPATSSHHLWTMTLFVEIGPYHISESHHILYLNHPVSP